MLRGPLYETDYQPHLSGHETFPIRYGWLKKAFDAVRETETGEDNRPVVFGPDAIGRFGVGKNMVASMRHWATVAGIIEDASDRSGIITTPLEVWPESHWPGFALRQADVIQSYTAW